MNLNKTTLKFLQLFYYWSGKLGVDLVPFRRDNRIDCHAIMTFYDDDSVDMAFNANRITYNWRHEHLLLGGVIHEIGHMLDDLPYETDADQIYSEFRAEVYMLSIVRYHNHKAFKAIVKYTKKKLEDTKWCNRFPIHYEAFKQIREYQ